MRLRWEAIRLGMERVKVKNGLMIDGPANRKSRGQLPENSRRKPFGDPLSDTPAALHDGQLDPGITNIDYEIHNSRKVL